MIRKYLAAVAMLLVLNACEQAEHSHDNRIALAPDTVPANEASAGTAPVAMEAFTFSGPAAGGVVHLSLPARYTIEGSVIYNQAGEKVGEFSPGLLTPVEPLSKAALLQIIAAGNVLNAREFQVDFAGHDSHLLGSGSVTIAGLEWQYAVKRESIDWEEEQGTWNAYTFAALFDDKVLIISFYDKEAAQEVNINKYAPYLQSIEVR
jgi:hypothetical protein